LNRTPTTRRARGDAKLNRTLSAPPASAIAPAATSQKFSLTIFLLRAPLKNSKKEREISARFRPPSIRAERRATNARGQKISSPFTPSIFCPLAGSLGFLGTVQNLARWLKIL